MLNNCVNIIEVKACSRILNEKNILLIDDLLSNRYLRFDAKKFQIIGPKPVLSNEEKAVVEEVNNISLNADFPPIGDKNFSLNSEFSLLKGRGFHIMVGIVFGFVLSSLIRLVIC